MANMMFIESPVTCKLINMVLVSDVDIEPSMDDPGTFEVIATTTPDNRHILYVGPQEHCDDFMERLKGALSSMGTYFNL